MKTIFKIVAALSIFSLLAIGGCALLIGGAAEEVEKEIKKEANSKGITKSQYRAIKLGTTKKQVIKKLGEPESEDETEIQLPAELEEYGSGKTECIQYSRKGDILSLYQFCFVNGKLESKVSI